MPDQALLTFRDVNTHYGDLHVLKDVNYTIGQGEIVSLLGGNASGKSTTMKTIMGVVRPTTGSVIFDGVSIERISTAERVRRGIAPVLEARRLFSRMTVLENLEMGAYTQKRGPGFRRDLDRVYSLFPRVKERLGQIAGTLSGGEQQMVAIGRALMARPRLICLDEPSMGLSPLYGDQPSGHDDLHGRAERQHGAVDRPPCLRAANREDGAIRLRGGTAPRPGDP
jgi:branched-chain amino acid transport system ATP-binding protein